MSADPLVFGRYHLLEPLAKGGMAEVFKARLVAAAGTEKLLCIKRILPALSRNPEFIGLFVKEARISLSLTHGNITQVFDFGEVQGVYYLAMEYIPGPDLDALLKRLREAGHRLDLPTALFIATEVCKGLHYAHTFCDPQGRRQVVVHRDVTPHNILISFNGQVKLTDFGIALAATRAAPHQSDRLVRGKAMYLSPEQVAGHPGEPRSDLFSLGTVIYEMITGVRPFEGGSERETLDRLRQVSIAPPSKYNEEVPPELDAAVLRALDQDPAKRHASAAELQVALSRILYGRWQEYTAEVLAETINDIFAWELSQETQSPHRPKDRLLFQLSRAGVSVDQGASTSELLELGTVAIAGAGGGEERPSARGQSRLALGGGIAALVVVITAGVLFFVSSADPPTPQAGPALDTTPMQAFSHQTEHLTPASIREPPVAPTAPPAPANHPAPAASRPKVAFLNCNSWPWSVVYLNGRRLKGNTPLFRVKVPAGRHRLRFENPELGLSKEVTVVASPGVTKTIAVSLQQ